MALQRRLARLEQRHGARPMRFVLVRAGDPEPVAREGELLFVMRCATPSGMADRGGPCAKSIASGCGRSARRGSRGWSE